ncbi:MAG: hypothetical protein QM727_11480 [Niabella sp.]
MKTSNKLLIALLVLVLVIPLLIMLSFKKAIQSDKYVVKNYYGDNVMPFRNLKPFHAAKLDGAMPDLLKCNIKHGDQYAYKFQGFVRDENDKADSCKISYIGDTLVITYHLKSIEEPNTSHSYSYGNTIDLTLPETVPVIAKGATIYIDSSSVMNNPMNFKLSDNAVLNISGGIKTEPIRLGDNLFKDSVIYQTIYPTIVIEADGSEVNIAQSPIIQNLKIDLKGTSKLNIMENASVGSLQGTISPESIVNAPYRFIQNLKTNHK